MGFFLPYFSAMYMRILFLATLLLTACTSGEQERVQYTYQGAAQGSSYSISVVTPLGENHSAGIDSVLALMDAEMSLWVDTSALSRLNRGDSVLLSKDLRAVFESSLHYGYFTGGAFDITLAPVIQAWGFSKGVVLDTAAIDSLMDFVGYAALPGVSFATHYRLPKGVKVDMNAIAQGYTVDRLAAYFEQRGVQDYLVEVGGELRCSGFTIDKRPWRIGIDKPVAQREEGVYQDIVVLDSMALATSGNYRKFWIDEESGQKVVHTIDPNTGYPVVSSLLSASVIAPTAMGADALATALMVMGYPEAVQFIEKQSGVEAYLIIGDPFGGTKTVETSGWKNYRVD